MLHFGAISRFMNYAIVEGAMCERHLPFIFSSAAEHASLYRETDNEKLVRLGPHLVRFGEGEQFASRFLPTAWGQHWGIFICSEANTEQLLRHFRHFLIVSTEANRKLYFRFYDPRVLRRFLPTCTARQLETLFGPVDFFVTESREYKIATIFGMERGGLTVKEIDLASEMKSSDLPQIAARSQERDIQTIV